LDNDKLDSYFPFRKLGLRSNPFRTLTAEEWADVAVVPQPIETAFNRGDNLLVLGRRGRGKSTTLRTLMRRVEWQDKRVAYERLPFGKWRYQTDISELDAFAPDEIQRLAVWEWSPLLAKVRDGMRLIMGSHRNDRWLFQLAGIPLTVFHLDRLNTPQHLQRVLQRRIEYFVLDDVPLVTLDDSAVNYLYQHYRDNMRAIEHFLYDVFQQLYEPTPITAELLYRCRL
jgi:Cdc6-like AAA superfamily ATPase